MLVGEVSGAVLGDADAEVTILDDDASNDPPAPARERHHPPTAPRDGPGPDALAGPPRTRTGSADPRRLLRDLVRHHGPGLDPACAAGAHPARAPERPPPTTTATTASSSLVDRTATAPTSRMPGSWPTPPAPAVCPHGPAISAAGGPSARRQATALRPPEQPPGPPRRLRGGLRHGPGRHLGADARQRSGWGFGVGSAPARAHGRGPGTWPRSIP